MGFHDETFNERMFIDKKWSCRQNVPVYDPSIQAGAVRAKKLDLVRFLGTSAKISKYVADIIIRNIGYMHIMPN